MKNKKVSHWRQFTSIVTYKTPVYEDGTVGDPEVEKKFTTERNKKEKKKDKDKEEEKESESLDLSKNDVGEKKW